MAVRLLFLCGCINAHVGLIVCLRSCARYMPPPGSMGVPSLWHCYFGGRRLKSLGTPVLNNKSSLLGCAL